MAREGFVLEPYAQAPDAVRLVTEAMAAFVRGDIDALVSFVHPDAEIEMVALGGATAHGPEGLRAALERAQLGVHRPTWSTIEPIAPDAAAMVGRIQHTDERGRTSDRKAVWLSVLRDGRIWRTRVVGSLEEARAAYAGLAEGPSPSARS